MIRIESTNPGWRLFALLLGAGYLYGLGTLLVQVKRVSPGSAAVVVLGGASLIMATLIVFGTKSIKHSGPVRRFRLDSIFLLIVPLSVYLAVLRWWWQGLSDEQRSVTDWVDVTCMSLGFMLLTTIVLLYFTDAVLGFAVFLLRAFLFLRRRGNRAGGRIKR